MEIIEKIEKIQAMNTQSPFDIFLSLIRSKKNLMPVLIDEIHAIECVTHFSGMHITTLGECQTGSIENVFLYQKAEDKKHLGVADIRRWIDEIGVQPYGESALYIVDLFDEATPEAMNAALKILEEPPGYAIILLIVKNPESVLETIRSRTMNLHQKEGYAPLDESIKTMIYGYYHGRETEWIQYLYNAKYDIDTALAILCESMRHTPSGYSDRIVQSIIDLFQVNENPRNILDRVFICK